MKLVVYASGEILGQLQNVKKMAGNFEILA